MATSNAPADISQDIVSAAKERRVKIARVIAALNAEDAELASFLQTAARIQARLAANQMPAAPSPPQTPKKATKKDVVDAATAMIRKKGSAVTTGEVVEAMEKDGWEIGTGASSASSVVSANLSAAPEIARGPEGRGWIESDVQKAISGLQA